MMKVNESTQQPEIELTEQELEEILAGGDYCIPNRTCDDQDQDQDQDKRW